ncbi:hypothetical protein Hanom_Chr04g00306481 [Helianthus anomalus]
MMLMMVMANIQKIFRRCFSHGNNQVILCLKNLDSRSIELHGIFTAIKIAKSN